MRRERFRYNNLPHAHGARHGAHNAATATMYRKAAGAFTHGRPKRAGQDVENGRVSIRVHYERIERDASRRAACINISRIAHPTSVSTWKRAGRSVESSSEMSLDELQSRASVRAICL